MKYFIFALAFVFGVPAGYFLSIKNRFIENTVFFLMIFFTVQNISINFVSRELLRGTSRGFEIGLVDLAALILFFLIIYRKAQYPVKKYPPGSTLYFLYLLFSIISIANSHDLLMSWFEAWKMIRMYFYFWVIYNYINTSDQLQLFMRYVSYIVIYIAFFVLKQKYLEGIFQTSGPFDHQNSMVMYLMVFNSLIFAYLLNQKNIRIWYWLTILGLGIICIISSLSRAGMVLFAISCLIILVLSFSSGISLKKVGITFLLILMGVGVMIKAMDSIVERFENAPEASSNTRILLAQAAQKMADRNLVGIGLNNFGRKIMPPYPYNDHIDYDPDNYEKDNRLVLVETIYLMIAAETGWHNLAVFLILILWTYSLNIKNFFKFKGTQVHFITIGLAGGLLMIYVESAFEWVLKQVNNYYQLMMIFGLIGAMTKIRKVKYKKVRMNAGKTI